MATMKRMAPPPSLFLVLFECGAFRCKRTQKAATDCARFEGEDGLCCGTEGHRGEIVIYDRRRPLIGAPPKRGKQRWAPLVIDGGKSR